MEREKKYYRAVCLLTLLFMVALVTALSLKNYYERKQFGFLESFCGELISVRPDTEQVILSALKNESDFYRQTGREFLCSYGYRAEDFGKRSVAAAAVFLAVISGGAFWMSAGSYWKKRMAERMEALTDYLERVSVGHLGNPMEESEDEFSKLQDEISKTVTMLFQTRDHAVKLKNS